MRSITFCGTWAERDRFVLPVCSSPGSIRDEARQPDKSPPGRGARRAGWVSQWRYTQTHPYPSQEGIHESVIAQATANKSTVACN
jgi:hypothetical protein